MLHIFHITWHELSCKQQSNMHGYITLCRSGLCRSRGPGLCWCAAVSEKEQEHKKKSPGPIDWPSATVRPPRRTLALLRPGCCWKPLRFLHLDFLLRGAPRFSPPVWVQGSGAGGWRLSPGCEQTGFKGRRRCGGSVCEAPGPALLCYPGLRVAALLPAFSSFFPAYFSSVSLWSLYPETHSDEFLDTGEKTHGEREDLNGLWLQDLIIPRFSVVRFCTEDSFKEDSKKKDFVCVFLSFCTFLVFFYSISPFVHPYLSLSVPLSLNVSFFNYFISSNLLYFSIFLIYLSLSLYLSSSFTFQSLPLPSVCLCPSICSSPSSIMAPLCRFSWFCCLLVLLVLPTVQSSFPRGGGSSSAECGPGKGADCPGETLTACLHLNTSQFTSDR